ncbi:MAG: hypothetical protein IJG19_06980 [Methanobrevibacter sp.]|uniref:UPF0146 family protein n=1 Tax=Methanobrevibacter sp. TaxID=66852 RepID=UPI0025EBF235|nr:UPF0146 family protein [Methanobrevibacter sp.]MBQ2613591.1 hypothetical protein [Methanobrevibacter sp.]MEE0025834.1 UPF0146 family protein [Methanobrevibacter sp.]
MWQSFAEYISSLCEKNPTKICEIGVGKFTQVFDYLNKQDNIEIIKTDIAPNDSSVIKDDVTRPDLKLFENLDIIYSIRPPSELQPYIIDLALKTKTKLIIKPLFNEDINTKNVKLTLKNYKKASFYTLGV